METFKIETAQRQQAKLRIGLAAPSGAGKTYSALQLAYGLSNDWNKIVVIDTEQGSASMYSDLGSYKVLKLIPPFTPERYIGALEAAEKAGFEVIIVDSISHAWMGKGGLLEDHEQLGMKDSYFKMTKPRHRRIIDRILQSTSHVIVTVRTKQGFAIAQEGDKSKVQKMGLDPITESNFDYEMTAYLDIGMNHMAEASKDRTKIFMKPGEIQHPTVITPDTGKMLKDWANGGVSVKEEVKEESQPMIDGFQNKKLTELGMKLGKTPNETLDAVMKYYGVTDILDVTRDQAAKYIEALIKKIKTKKDIETADKELILESEKQVQLPIEDNMPF